MVVLFYYFCTLLTAGLSLKKRAKTKIRHCLSLILGLPLTARVNGVSELWKNLKIEFMYDNVIRLLEEKVDIITFNLREFIDLKDSDSWKKLNAKKREYKRAIQFLKAGNKSGS